MEKIIDQKENPNKINKKEKLILFTSILTSILLLISTAILAYQNVVLRKTPTNENRESGQNAPAALIDESVEYINKEFDFLIKYPGYYQISTTHALFTNHLLGTTDFEVNLLRNVYEQRSQTPEINLAIFPHFFGWDLDVIANMLEEMVKEEADSFLLEDTALYKNTKPPEVLSKENVTISQIPMIKIVRYLGPGVPNPEITEYYFKNPSGTKVFVLWSNHDSEFDQNRGVLPGEGNRGLIELEDLEKIIQSFKFLNTKSMFKEIINKYCDSENHIDPSYLPIDIGILSKEKKDNICVRETPNGEFTYITNYYTLNEKNKAGFIYNHNSIELGHGGPPFLGIVGDIIYQTRDGSDSIYAYVDYAPMAEGYYSSPSISVRGLKKIELDNGEALLINVAATAVEQENPDLDEITKKYLKGDEFDLQKAQNESIKYFFSEINLPSVTAAMNEISEIMESITIKPGF